jgi:hypothetical protein
MPDEIEKPRQTPAEFLASIPGAPSATAISEAKSQAPGGRVSVITLDGKIAYVVRALSGLEAEKAAATIPTNATNREREYQISVVGLCTVWTNANPNSSLDRMSLLAGPAGVIDSLFQKILSISGYMDPAQLDLVSGDL